MRIREFLDRNLPPSKPAEQAPTTAEALRGAAAERRGTATVAGIEDDLINLLARVASLEVAVRDLQAQRPAIGGR